MKKVLITGALGQLGRALTKTLDLSRYEIVRADITDDTEFDGIRLDITDEEAVNKAFSELKPDIVVNCAAFTAVDLCETKEELAYSVNALGPANLAKAAEANNAVLVHISTDYVFDGKATSPYKPADKTAPVSAYGRGKQKGEEFVLQNCKRAFIVRTAWLYGEGKNFVRTMLRLAENNTEIKVVEDQVGCPTSAKELAAIIAVLIKTEKYGIYHGVCCGVTSWYGFAKEIFRLAGKDNISVIPIKACEYPSPTERPSYSVLDNSSLIELGCKISDWKDALKEYMA